MPRLTVALDEAGVGRVLPDREPRAGGAPGVERLGVGSLARADPLEQVERQAVDRVGHGSAVIVPRRTPVRHWTNVGESRLIRALMPTPPRSRTTGASSLMGGPEPTRVRGDGPTPGPRARARRRRG